MMPSGRRPRGAESGDTVLVRALIRRQDAIAARTVARINDVLDSHLSLASAAYSWGVVSRAARARFAALAEALVARVPATLDVGAVRRALDVELAEVLAELDRGTALFGPGPATRPREETRAEAQRSRNLAEARAQVAELQAQLMDLRERVRRGATTLLTHGGVDAAPRVPHAAARRITRTGARQGDRPPRPTTSRRRNT